MSSSSETLASATISKSCRPGPVERSTRGGANSIPCGWSARAVAVAREQPHADALVGDDQVLDPAVRLERRAQLGVADAGDDEVVLPDRQPEQLVADGAADDVGVEAERVDVVGDRAPGARVRQRWAIASISTRAPDGSFATSTVERAGGRSPTCRA